MSKGMQRQLETLAHNLELSVAIFRLLSYLIPGSDWSAVNTGRYDFLGKIITQRPKFLKVLLNVDDALVKKEWSAVLKEQESNVQFLHGLAVLYREQALASSGDSSEGERSWLISTALWSLLISTEVFWDYFSLDRITNRDTGERDTLTSEDQEFLRESILGGILSSHGSLGNRNFVAGQLDEAQVHFHCLDLCRQGEEALIESLREHSLTCKLNPAGKLLSKVRTFADETLDDVCNGIVREAKKISSNPEIIRRLDEGIRKNYEGGIRYIDNFIKLDIPVIRVLRQSLEWYNHWCYDLYVTQQIDRVKQLMKPAIVIAEQLIPLCTKGQAYRPENHALSQHYLFRGFTTDEPQNAVSEYEEALEWNISNDNAKQLLGDAYKSIVMKQLDRAVERAKKNDFSGAFEIMDAVEKQIEDSDASSQERVRSTRAYICFQYANMLADDGRFREALKYAKQTHEIIPDHEVVKKLVDEMKEYAPEEDNLRSLKSAREVLDKERYDQAIKYAAEVSTGSRFHGSACRVQSSAFFHRGMNAANKERFDDAVKDLEHALKLNDDNEDRKVISKQLEILRQNRIGLEVKKAFDSNNWTRAEQILRSELKKNLSQNFKTDLQKYLSMVLNAKAVDLINETKKIEKEFADAINDIMKTVKEQPGVQ
ncbi:MAG: hypothetical protein J7K35_06580 [Syntrophobacterales bacterium]|nr:hypothetical protein [Syntrophobacterales bacterium]